MQAGLEHLSWAGGTLKHVDLLLLVAQPTLKSLMTAARTHELADQLGIREVAVVGNRVTDPDRHAVERFARERGLEVLALLPEDEGVRDADRAGASVLDIVPPPPAAVALAALARRLDARFPAGVTTDGSRSAGS